MTIELSNGPAVANSLPMNLDQQAEAATEPPLPPLLDQASLISVQEVRQALVQLSLRSTALENKLQQAVTISRTTITTSQNRIQSLAPQVELIRDEAKILNTRLATTADTARRVSKRIRSLDEEKKRLTLATQWALNTSELKQSLIDLAKAIDEADWDEAVRHCVKALTIPAEVLNSKFAASVVPTTELPDDPPTTLLSLRKRLLDIFVRAFRRATDAKETADATRFFKLLPQVGWRAEGLAAYSDFATDLVREHCRSLTGALATGVGQGANLQPFFYSTLLTRLFEHMALVVDRHQPLVDKYYGPGSFASGVMSKLQMECDRLGGQVLRSWKEERKLKRKVDLSRLYRPTALLDQATQNVGRGNPFSITRPGTPAGSGGGALTIHTSSSGSNLSALGGTEEDGAERREVDQTLAEASAIGSTWATYKRFLTGRLKVESSSAATAAIVEDDSGENRANGDGMKDFRKRSSSITPASATPHRLAHLVSGETFDLDVPPIAESSALGREVKHMLHEEYVLLETWHLRSSLERAHRIDSSDASVKPLTSSILDDAFFVIRAVLARVLSTSDVDTTDAMISRVKKAMEEDYLRLIERRLEDVYRGASAHMNVDGPRKETATREMRTAFITYLNVLHVSITYSDRVVRDLGSEEGLSQFYDEVEAREVSLILQALDSVSVRIRSTLRTQLDLLFAQLTRPRLRPVLTEAYRDATYVLDERTYEEASASDQVSRRFLKGWNHVLSIYRDLFDEANYQIYHSLAIDSIVRPWEKLVMGMKFTELGALRFDKDVRSISTFIANETRSSVVREKFTRLQQMSYILNLDPTEDEEENAYESAAASGMNWRLSNHEVKTIKALRIA